MGKIITERELNAALELFGRDYPEHRQKVKLHKKNQLPLVEGPKKGSRLCQKFVTGGSDESDKEGGSDGVKKQRKTTLSKVSVKDARSWWSGYPLRHPDPHRVNHRSKIAADRSRDAAASRDEASGSEMPKPPLGLKTAPEPEAPRYIDSDEEEESAVTPPEPVGSLEIDAVAIPEEKVETVIDPPILLGVWKTDDIPPHVVKYLGDKLKVVYSAYTSASFRRALEADKSVTHAPAVHREKLKDPKKPEVDNIPLDIQRAAMFDLFGEWAMSYGGKEPFPVNGPATHPGVVVADYRTRINRFISSLSAHIYKNLSNRDAKLLELDEEIAVSLLHFHTDWFDAKEVKDKAIAAYAFAIRYA